MLLLGTQRINQQGHFEIGGVDSTSLAGQYGTPLYVLDEATIRANCRAYRAAFAEHYPNTSVCFAGKAMLCGAVCRIVDEEGLNLDVASSGELYVALAAGFPRERINLHGNNKSLEELGMAVGTGVSHVVVDNFLEIENLQQVCVDLDRDMHVLVRCSPGVDPHTHKAISTGQADTKFGFNITDGAALEALRRVQASDRLHFDGIHCHIGSQLLDMEAHESALLPMVSLVEAARDELSVSVGTVNIGGGLGIRYLEGHQPPSLSDFAQSICSKVTALLEARSLPLPLLQLEPGRSIVGEAGTTLYTIGAVKTVPIKEAPGKRTYVTVDGGLSDNPRPQLYDAQYTVISADKASAPHDTLVTVAGKHCETDTLFRDVRLADPAPGDLMAVLSTGAYNHVMASNYNMFRRPAVVLVNEGQSELIVRRETFEDLIRRDQIPSRLAVSEPTTAK